MTKEMEMEEGGIYILITPGDKGDEYRIVHAYSSRGITGKDKDGSGDEAVDKTMVKKMFGHCRVFTDKIEADKYADNMYYRYEMSDPFLVAAGIVRIGLGQPFSFYAGRNNVAKKKAAKKESSEKKPKARKPAKPKNNKKPDLPQV